MLTILHRLVQGRRRFKLAQDGTHEDHDGFERLRHPVDRNGRSMPNRYTTAELDEALGEYRAACDAASQAVRRKLRELATTLSVPAGHPAFVVLAIVRSLLAARQHIGTESICTGDEPPAFRLVTALRCTAPHRSAICRRCYLQQNSALLPARWTCTRMRHGDATGATPSFWVSSVQVRASCNAEW